MFEQNQQTQSPQQPQAPQGAQGQPSVDPTIINLAKAIRQKESGGDYSAVGDAGTSTGAFQFQPNTWKLYAGQILGDQNAPMTRQNQNAVVYGKLKQFKDQGWNAAQSVAAWNAGEQKAADGSWTNNVGTTEINGQKIKYNTPQYVKDVMGIYQKLKQGSQYGYITQAFPESTPSPQQQQPTGEQSLGQELSGRLSDASQNISDLAANLQGKGKQSPISDILQTGGAAAGAVGDVIQKGLELIPGVKWLEDQVGVGAGQLAQTPEGKSVVNAMQQFSQQHPELSKDIGAGFNIITAIPILKGLGAIKDIAMTGVGRALEGVAANSVDKDLTSMAIASGKNGLKFVQDNPGIYKEIATEKLPLDMVEGKLNIQPANDEIWSRITNMNDQVKPILDNPKYSTFGVDGESVANKAITGYTDRFGNTIEGIPNSGETASSLIQNAKDLNPRNAGLWDKFAAGQANFKEINQLRSDLDSIVKKVFTDAPSVSWSKEKGAMLSSAMRDFIQSNAPETQPIFQRMSRLFQLKNALKYVEGKRIKTGLVRNILQRTAGGLAGAGVARLMGAGMIPEAIAGYAGERAAGLLGRKEVGGVLGSLLRR